MMMNDNEMMTDELIPPPRWCEVIEDVPALTNDNDYKNTPTTVC